MLNKNVSKLVCFVLTLLIASFFPGLSLAGSRGYAIIVGVSDYAAPGLDLNFCDDDAQDIYDVLPASDWDGVTLLKDSQATKANILNAITSLSGTVGSNDIVFFHYSGHGANRTDSQGNVQATYISPHDINLNNWDNDISETELEDAFGQLATNNVCVMIDSCNSGGFIGKGPVAGAIRTHLKVGQVPPSKRQLEKGPALRDIQRSGYVVLTACAESELSVESGALQNGVFTYYVVEGLSGSADSSGDGVISAEEVYNYVAPLATAYNSGQHAQLYDGNGSTEFSLKPFRAGRPSCPDLYSWNGEEWQNNGFAYAASHCPESEFYYERAVTRPVAAQGNTVRFKVVEVDGEISYTNSVAMYYDYKRRGESTGEWTELDLLSAVHNRAGEVGEALREKDDERVSTGPGDEILLTYSLPSRGLEDAEFICVSSGYYLWTDETWCEILDLDAEVKVQPGGTVTLKAKLNNIWTEELPEGAVVWFDVKGPDWTGTKVASVSAAGLAPGSPRWYSCDWSVPGEVPAGTYTCEASVWIGESDITWRKPSGTSSSLNQPGQLKLSSSGDDKSVCH